MNAEGNRNTQRSWSMTSAERERLPVDAEGGAGERPGTTARPDLVARKRAVGAEDGAPTLPGGRGSEEDGG